MNALNQTQQVIELLEKDLFHIEYEKVSKLTGIPLGVYQRIFGYICEISISEYVRRRKLTVSAEMLLAGSANVTEIAFTCGYESSTSYTRAFKEQFHVPPIHLTAKILKENGFKPLILTDNDTYYVLKGKRIMAELVKIAYENTEDMLLIGVSNKEYGVKGRELWDVYFGQHFDDKLTRLKEYQVGMEDCIGLGYSADFPSNKELGETYIVGKFFKADTPVPEGMTGRIIRGGTIVKAQIGAENFEDILNNAYLLIADMVPKNGYALDYEDFYWIEFYTVSRYCTAVENGAKQIICDWIMPCKKQEV
ncbi:AraC family transcriptional regulator [Anaerocolumna cellulosilytica]|uniref:AraC family transcriptional regulator n=1 Tax=Anaerocolumna cellulosilytica TaxID=433286 RepID=A0A6S6QTY6_9FIRM|nr:AraC family transcriptional regulator [Anaerocolumna cellulosilytica]MBB5196121.1 AraC family transcriptional regulator [Anaerocolumna cellulosilytica]BCJ92559.1 AraC family transcriptional regulator [Anaerocolumna cellulosilytica]